MSARITFCRNSQRPISNSEAELALGHERCADLRQPHQDWEIVDFLPSWSRELGGGPDLFSPFTSTLPGVGIAANPHHGG